MPDIETLTLFSTVVQEIAAQRDIPLDGNLVGQTAVDRFRKEITPESCVLSNCTVLEAGTSHLLFSATIKSLLSCTDVRAKILLFDIDATTAADDESIRKLLLFLYFPATFLPDSLFRHFAIGQEVIEDASADSAILELSFSDKDAPVLFFSSTDSIRDFTEYPSAFEAIKPWKDVEKGTYCNLSAALDVETAAALNVLSIPGTFILEGAIDGDTGVLSLVYSLNITKTFGPFSFSLKSLDIGVNLASPGLSLPAFGLSAHLDFGIGVADLSAYIDIISHELSFQVEDIHIAMNALDTFAGKFAGAALTDLTDLLPGSVTAYGVFYVALMQAVISLDDGHVNQVGFQLTTEKAIPLIDNVVTLSPYFTFDVWEPFNDDNRDIDIRIDGAWELGTSFFDLVVLTQTTADGKTDYQVSGALRQGQTLDVGALTDKVFGKEVIPAGLEIVDFEFDASVNDQSLDISLDVLSDWDLQLGGAAFAIEEVELSLSYANKEVTECAIYGRLELFSLDMAISGDYSKENGWVISGGLAPDEQLAISTLLPEVIQTFQSAKPAAMMDSVKQLVGDMTVQSLLIVYSIGQGTLSVFTELDNVLHFPCLSINKIINQVTVTDTVLTGNCLVNLTVGGVDIFLNTEKKDEDLIFSGGLPVNTLLPAGRLVDDIFAKFTGVSLPGFLSGITVSMLNIVYNTATRDYAFAIKGTMKVGDSTPVISLDIRMVHATDQSYTQKINAAIDTRTSLADMAVSFGFNGTAVPGILNDLIFSGVSFSYDSATGITKYNGSGTIVIEDQTVQLQLTVDQAGDKAHYEGNFTWLSDPDDKSSGLHFLLESVKDISVSSMELTLVFTIKGVSIDLKASATDNEDAGVKVADKQFSGSTSHLNLSVTDVLDDLLQALCPDYKTFIPVAFIPDIVIQDIYITYDGKAKQTNVAALITAGGKVIKIFFQRQSKSNTLPNGGYAFGITADMAGLGDLPLVGGELKEVSLNGTGFVYTSGAGDFFLPQIVAAFSDTTSASDGKLVLSATSKSFSKGFNLIGEIDIPGYGSFFLSLPPGGLSLPAASASVQTPADTAETGAMVKWFQLGQKLGPVTVNKLGFAYNLGNSKKIALLIDGDLAAGGLDLALQGMGISILPTDLFHGKVDSLSFQLSGLGLTFEKGPVEISAAFTRSTQKINNVDVDVYNGGVILKMEECMITGIGSYAKTGNDASLFIFGLYEGNIGGPVFFFVTGIAVGFGYNRKVNIPAVNEVHQFPLVAMAMQPDASKGIAEVLSSLETRDSNGNLPIEIATGEYWLAAGIKFTSFKIVESFVLLTVNFGHDVEFAILGLSRLTWPEKSILPSPIVYVELAVLAHFGPGSEVIAIEGILTPNSYLLSRSCILTGGFACHSWVAGEHEGDFVITLGGYHPKFKKPGHYPVVPRLGYVWKIGSLLSITGEMYYALTPTAIMAGGRMEVLFQISVLSASLTVWANMLISWAPFQYSLDIGVCVKIDAHITIFFVSVHFSLEMDATLHIWGPPFAGEAYVDWTIFSFTIPFGASDKTAPAPLEWKQFSGTYLPPAPINIVISRGIIKQIKDPGDNQQVKYTTINPHELRLDINTIIPVNNLFINGVELQDTIPMQSGTGTVITRDNVAVNNTYGAREKALGIRPCGLNSDDHLAFGMNVTVRLGDIEQEMTIACIAKGVADALWGSEVSTTNNQDPGTAKVVENVLSGLTICPPALQHVSSIRELDFSQLFDRSETLFTWKQELAETGKAYHAYDVFDTISTSFDSADVVSERNRLLDLFNKATGAALTTDETDMSSMMASPADYFTAPPVLCLTGQIPQYPTDTQ
ncbi:DUF6603 domain-containing protein [Chitinophaga eiseniae]|uniref:DUF6603 domain-containing protein n=1 Tax=Chitinophaga eiseniae TaxID=634771 RepID=A0A847SIT5_9BACT|nr:DUF6603 domain-containing protein [Chitinophaga eiseniae]NLR77298.1 hypothetical protein [Chitinophaga eiseniae]